jgi:integrase
MGGLVDGPITMALTRHALPHAPHPLNQANLYYHWNKVRAPLALEREEAGLPGVRFHDLRHFCATQLLELGLSHSTCRSNWATRMAGRS